MFTYGCRVVAYVSQMLSALSVGPLGERVQKVSEGSQRRAKQLSVIFSQYITSMMNSGEVCPELVDLNFEIQQVSFTSPAVEVMELNFY